MDKYLTMLILILILGLAIRLYPAIHWGGIYTEPDVYIYFSVASETYAHNFMITSLRSGVPNHPYSEFPGLVLFPAYVSYLTHISIYDIIYYSGVLMGLLGILGVYLVAYEFMHKKWVALFAAFLYAALPATLYRSMAGEYRGEVFVAVFLIYIMLLLIKMDRKNWWYCGPAVAGLVALSVWWWSGGAYVLVVLAIYLGSFIIFALLPKALKRAADPSLRNWLTYLIIVLVLICGYPIFLSTITYFQHLAGGLITFQASAISELAPTSVYWLVTYYGWVFVAAILGFGLMVYYDRKEYFHKSQFALFSLFVPGIFMLTIAVRWLILFSAVGCIYAAYMVYALFTVYKVWEKRQLLITIGLCAVVLVLGLNFILTYAPGDYNNYQFIAALSWMKNNTPANSTVLTLWPDGSVVEGVANRTSYTDSIMSQNIGIGPELYSKAGNYSYIENVSPTYLLVRKTWLSEAISILYEDGLPLNTSYNGTDLQQLERLDNATPPPFPIVFQNNDTIIYQVKR